MSSESQNGPEKNLLIGQDSEHKTQIETDSSIHTPPSSHVLKYKVTASKSHKENEKNTDPVGRPVEKSQLKSIIDSHFGCNLDLSLVNNATTTLDGRYMIVCKIQKDCKYNKVKSKKPVIK